ncbi:MAG: porin [Ruegeria sp.]
MKNLIISGAVATGLIAGAAHAVEVTGGYVELGYSSFTDTDIGSRYNLNGAGELAFSRSFSLQLDAGTYRFNEIDESGTNVTLHGNFHASDNLSLGAFYGRDSIDGDDLDFYGVEAGFDAGQVDIEGYLGRHEVDGVSGLDGNIFGLAMKSYATDQLELMANYDLVDNFGGLVDANVYSVGANYALSDNAEVFGTLGAARLDAFGFSNTEAFVSFGVRMNLGNARGTTFDRRGVLDKLPGL